MAGHSGHSDQPNVTPTTDSTNPARERDQPTYRGKSDALDYHGPVVAVPDLGPDQLDAHGAPREAPKLSVQDVLGLTDWYKGETHRRYNQNTLDTPAVDAELRAKLAALGVPPARIEVEFKRVMDLAFAM